jgi:hypothetical protein
VHEISMHEHIADDLEIVEFARLKKVQGEQILRKESGS